MTIYSLDVLLFLFGTSLLFHVQFSLLLPDLHIGFSRDRSGGLVFLSLSEFSTVYCDPHSPRLWHSQKGKNRCFPGTLFFFNVPADVGNLISGSSAFSKTSLNICKFMVHVLLKPGLQNFEHYFTACELRTSLDDNKYIVDLWSILNVNENHNYESLW